MSRQWMHKMMEKRKLFWGLITMIALLGVISMSLLFRICAPPPMGDPTPPMEPPPSIDPAPPMDLPSAMDPASPMDPAPSDPFDAIDRILERMEFGNIAFNAPGSMNLRDTAIIQLMLGLETEINELEQMIEAEGEKEGARIRVSDRMEARLSGTNLAITAITPEIQAVSRSDVTEWKWEVKPTGQGRQYLHLTLSVLIGVDGTSTTRVIRIFSKVIEVEITRRQRIGSFFEKNWQWLWAAILVPIAGWLWKRRRADKAHVGRFDR